jgi:hypothetical protein
MRDCTERIDDVGCCGLVGYFRQSLVLWLGGKLRAEFILAPLVLGVPLPLALGQL